jgi:hypothetical protein
MKQFIESIRRSVERKNWYAALSIALMLPDICGQVESPNSGSKARYISWFQKHMAADYIKVIGKFPTVFFNGVDCYELRCAYFYQGEFDFTTQSLRKVLEKFRFIVPPPGCTVHLKRQNTILQLQIDIFCEEICLAVEHWLKSVVSDKSIKERIASLPSIEVISDISHLL